MPPSVPKSLLVLEGCGKLIQSSWFPLETKCSLVEIRAFPQQGARKAGKIAKPTIEPTQTTRYNIAVITALKPTVLLSLILLISAASPAQQVDTPKVSTISILVVKEHGAKPVKNAEVVLHVLDKDGNEKQDGLELKTHEDGKTSSDGIPYGKVRIQVIARGFRTWGNDFDVSKPNMSVTVKLQKPQPQFSIYK